MRKISICLTVLLLAADAYAQEETVPLKSGPGLEVVEKNCGACHSVDYLRINSFLNRQGWEAEVNKMIKAFAAPVEPGEAKIIVDYLTAHYGSGS